MKRETLRIGQLKSQGMRESEDESRTKTSMRINMLFSQNQYQLFRDELIGGSIGTLWSAMRADNFDKPNLSFDEKKAYFFELLQKLLQEGVIKLAKHGELLDGEIENQITRYKFAFPKTEDEWKARGEDTWFYENDCPGGIVWVLESGYLDWT